MADVQHAAIEIKEMLQHVQGCDTTNPIHAAKIIRIGELHINKAKAFSSKLKAEIKKTKRGANDCKVNGLRNISNAIGSQQTRPLACVFRDRDTPDGIRKVR